MQPTTLKELEWLHDAVLLDVVYDAKGVDREVRLSIRCDPDSGHTQWAGQNLLLVAKNVAVVRHSVWGWFSNPETIDSVRPEVSAITRREMDEALLKGARFPDLGFLITFHSGSALEIVCSELKVQLTP